MTVSSLVRKLVVPLGIMCLFFTATTMTGHFLGLRPDYVGFISRQLDVRYEGNVATWFSSLVFLVCGLSFVPLAFAGDGLRRFPRWFRVVFLLYAIGFVFLSADESGAIHERIGLLLERSTGLTQDTSLDGLGYSWLLIYAPVALAGLGVVVFMLTRLITGMPDESGLKSRARTLLVLAALSGPGVLGFEALQAASQQTSWVTILPLFEETLELAMAYCLLACNAAVATAYDL